ncbi:MAG: hypothetical protein Q9187_006907 [Circinaria calcarea]
MDLSSPSPYTLSRARQGFCTPTLHFLTCGHVKPTTHPTRCSAENCETPYFGAKRLTPLRCRACARHIDAAVLLALLAQVESWWGRYAKLEARHFWDRPRELEELEDRIWGLEGEMRTAVHRDVWRTYQIEGKEGLEEEVRRWEADEEAREAEEEERARAWAEWFEAEGENGEEEEEHERPEGRAEADADPDEGTLPLTDEEIRNIVGGNEGGAEGMAPLESYWEGEYTGEDGVEEDWEIASV